MKNSMRHRTIQHDDISKSTKHKTIIRGKSGVMSAIKRGISRAVASRRSASRAIAGGTRKKHVRRNKRIHIKKGGSSINGPIGYPWDGGDIRSWPGVQGNQGLNTQGATMSNHFSLSKNGIVVGGIDTPKSTTDDILMKPPINGGKKHKTAKRVKQHGGFFQEITNLGRGVQSGLNLGYFNFIGKQQPISQNPYPTQEQLIDNHNMNINTNSLDIKKIYTDANNSVIKA